MKVKEKVYMRRGLTSIWTEVHNEMKATIDILNEGYSGDEELVIEECSGHTEDHSDRVKELIEDDHTCEGGAWVTAIDGRVIGEGHFHPFRIHVTNEDTDSPLNDIDSGDIDEYATLG